MNEEFKNQKNQNNLSIFLRNCDKDCEPIELKIKGTIPLWLRGTLLRNGPGQSEVGREQYKHIFDSLALIRKFDIANGKVVYQHKLLRSKTFSRNMDAQRIVISEFGTTAVPDPCFTLFQRFMACFQSNEHDNNLINLVEINDKIYALGETPTIYEIHEDTLDKIDEYNLKKILSVNSLTAHPHIDHKTGDIFNIGSSALNYKIVKFTLGKSFDKAEIVSNIKIERPLSPSYYHSFSMTENYFIFIEQSWIISIPMAIKCMFSKASSDCIFKWDSDREVRFFIIRRNDGKLLEWKYISKPFLFFHTINAYEDDEQIVIDVCCYDDDDVLKTFYRSDIERAPGIENNSAKQPRCEARRFVLPLMSHITAEQELEENLVTLSYTKATAVIRGKNEILCEPENLVENQNYLEMPSINYRFYNGRKYRYFYSWSRNEENDIQLIKVDLLSNTSKMWMEYSYYPCEPIFVARPEAVDEDDGVVLSSVVSISNPNEGFLLVLDGKSFEEIGRAIVNTGHILTGCYHGIFKESNI